MTINIPQEALDQAYLAPPMRLPWERDRVERALNQWKLEAGKRWRESTDSPERRELGMMLHDVENVLGKLHQPQYEKKWSELQALYYPDRK